MRSFYLQFRIYATENWPFFWNLSSNLQSSLVFLYANSLYASIFFRSLSLAYNERHLYYFCSLKKTSAKFLFIHFRLVPPRRQIFIPFYSQFPKFHSKVLKRTTFVLNDAVKCLCDENLFQLSSFFFQKLSSLRRYNLVLFSLNFILFSSNPFMGRS